jgi:Fic family protein
VLFKRYEHTPVMARAIAQIDDSRSLLEQHLKHPEDWHGVIRRQVMAAVVHYSTAIEGNILTRDQVESIIAGEAIEVPQKDRTEALNYFRAMRWAQTRSQDANWRLTHETILTLHFMVGTELGVDYEPLGQYRHGQNNVQDRRTGESIYWPPRPGDVQGLMDEFVDWARRRSEGGTNPYVVNALAHLNFVAIHPFSDGNGRVGRLLCSLLMMREGYKAQAFWSLEQYLGEHASDYGEILAATLGPRWEPDRVVATRWVEWYLMAVATQVSDAQTRLGRSMAEFSAVLAGLDHEGVLPDDPRLVARTVIPVWLAVMSDSVTRRQLARYSTVSEETLSRDLRRLSGLGVLTAIGRGRGAHYVPGPVVKRWGPFDLLVEAALQDGASGAARKLASQSGTPTSARTNSSPTLFDA